MSGPEKTFHPFAESEGEGDEGSDDEEDVKPNVEKRDWPKTGHDVGENKTVFVRNLSFDSEEEELKAMLEESFGKVLFARMVVDKVTNHPKVRHSTDCHCQHLLAWICPQSGNHAFKLESSL